MVQIKGYGMLIGFFWGIGVSSGLIMLGEEPTLGFFFSSMVMGMSVGLVADYLYARGEEELK